MAQQRGVAEWFSLTFEHSADVFCCHDTGTQTELASREVSKLSFGETLADHPPTDKAVVAGND